MDISCTAVTNYFLWCFIALLSQSPKAFLESYEDMLLYTQREETWPVTKMELEGRGVSDAVIHVMNLRYPVSNLN